MEVPEKYVKYVDVFSKKVTIKLPKYMEINDHPLDLEEGKKPPYKPRYSLRPVELKTLKTYIEDNLKNGFIKL